MVTSSLVDRMSRTEAARLSRGGSLNQRAGATRNPGTILLAEDSAVYRRLTGDLQVFVLHQYSLRASNQPPRSESNT